MNLNDEQRRDLELVRLAQAGDEQAFADLVRRTRGSLASYLKCFLRDERDREEIASNAFLKAHRGIANFRCECPFSAWLFLIAKRLAINRHKYLAGRRRIETQSIDAPLSDGDFALADVIADPAGDGRRLAEFAEMEADVLQAYHRLPAPQRRTLDLRENLSYEEIAAESRVPVGTVKSRLARARGMLRARMAA